MRDAGKVLAMALLEIGTIGGKRKKDDRLGMSRITGQSSNSQAESLIGSWSLAIATGLSNGYG